MHGKHFFEIRKISRRERTYQSPGFHFFTLKWHLRCVWGTEGYGCVVSRLHRLCNVPIAAASQVWVTIAFEPQELARHMTELKPHFTGLAMRHFYPEVTPIVRACM